MTTTQLTPQKTSVQRIPLNTLAIGLGLSGLADAWGAATDSLAFPAIVGELVWIPAAVAWVWLIVAHASRGVRSEIPLATQLRHPAQGPIFAILPITGMLLAGELLTILPAAGVTLYVASLVAAALFAGWLLARWLRGGLDLDAVHGGYLLPTVAAGFVGATVAAHARLALLGWGLFAVGTFFWVAMTLLVLARLAFRPALPDPLVPTLAILVAPPGVAGVALFALAGDHPSAFAAAIAGLGVLLVLVQLALVPRYLKLRFSLGFWSFTFPTAAIATDAMVWVRIEAFPGWQVVTVVLLAAVTALIGGIGVRSIVEVAPPRRESAAELVLTRADDAIAEPERAA